MSDSPRPRPTRLPPPHTKRRLRPLPSVLFREPPSIGQSLCGVFIFPATLCLLTTFCMAYSYWSVFRYGGLFGFYFFSVASFFVLTVDFGLVFIPWPSLFVGFLTTSLINLSIVFAVGLMISF